MEKLLDEGLHNWKSSVAVIKEKKMKEDEMAGGRGKYLGRK